MLAFAALAGLALWFLVNSYYNGQISGQEEHNAYLQTQISQVDTKIKEIEDLDRQKSRLLARKEVIEQLQANRSQMVHLFDSLVRTIPDGVVRSEEHTSELQSLMSISYAVLCLTTKINL